MHELSIASGIRDVVLAQAQEAGCRRVIRVTLRIGALTGVEPEALRFCFDALVQSTVAAGAILEIEPVPAQGHCAACAVTFDLGFVHDACPTCGERRWTLVSGRELAVKELEVD
jgi:hydrogenase nickel incorporation protein HypA/HybF